MDRGTLYLRYGVRNGARKILLDLSVSMVNVQAIIGKFLNSHKDEVDPQLHLNESELSKIANLQICMELLKEMIPAKEKIKLSEKKLSILDKMLEEINPNL